MIAARRASTYWVLSFGVCLVAASGCSSSSSPPGSGSRSSGEGSASSSGGGTASSSGGGGTGLHCISLNKSGAEAYCEAYASGPESCNGDGGQRQQLASCFPPVTTDTPIACCIDSSAAYICYFSSYLSGSTISQITQSGCTGGGGQWIDPATQASLPF
jgi:hypothetical protein